MSQALQIISKLISGFAGGLRKPAPDRAPLLFNRLPQRYQKRTRTLTTLLASAFATGVILVLIIRAGETGSTPPVRTGPEMENLGQIQESIAPQENRPLAIQENTQAHRWNAIVLHHSGTKGGSTRSFDYFHRAQRGWRSLGYHFVIGNGVNMPDGKVESGPRWRKQESGAHAHSYEYNRNGIGICLVGNFENTRPTKKQLEATITLIRKLRHQFNIPLSRVFGHRQIREGGSTACPGKYFPYREILQRLSESE